MHILIVSRGLPSESYPLNGIFEFDQAKALAEAGLRVTYFAIDLRSIRRKRQFGITKEAREGVDCYNYNLPLGAVPLTVLLKVGSWALRRLYRKVFINSKPDIIHAHFTEYGYIAAKLCEEITVPLVITEHSSEMNKTQIKPDLLNAANFAYKKASAVIAVGEQLRNNIADKTGVKAIVVPNIMSDQSFLCICKRENKDYYGYVFTGRLIDRKRPFLLLDAFNSVAERYPNTRLGIIGDGVLRQEIVHRIAEYRLQDKVILYGALKRDSIAEVYAGYDCFILPSVRETFGVVCIEAMAAGLPVIATRSGGPEDFITQDVGLLTASDDKKELENAMEYMLLNAGKYNSDRIKQYVRNSFSPEIIARKIIEIYMTVIS